LGQSWISAPAHLFLLALLAVVVLGTFVPSALARTTRVYESSFGSFPSAPSGGRGPTALTVDQSTGSVYAFTQVDSNVGRVSRFTAAGAPDNFTAGAAAGSNTLTGFNQDGTVAVDHSGGPLDGDIFVSDEGDETVEIFANDGASIGKLDGSGTSEGAFTLLCGVAVDQSNGDIYVAQSSGADSYGKIWRYSPASPAGAIDDADFTVTGVSAERVCGGVAADSGHIYAVDTFSHRLEKFAVASFVVHPPAGSAGVIVDKGPATGVYVDPKNGDIYSNHGSSVSVFDAGGAFLYEFGFAANFGTNSAGVAVRSAASGAAARAYVADRHLENDPSGREIDVFGPVTNVPTATHPAIATFGRDGTSATSFEPGLDQLSFRQTSRQLFALISSYIQGDPTKGGIYGFGAAGAPTFPALAGFAPLVTVDSDFPNGHSSSLAVDDSGLGSDGNLYLVSGTADLLYGFDSTGAALGGAFPVDPATDPGAPAGSPKDLCGAAVDSSGNVWVSNSSTNRILKYSSAGLSLAGTIDTSAQGGPCRLAFDSVDNLYVATSNTVWRYTAASGYTSSTRVDSSLVNGLAVDPSNDHLYVAHLNWVDEYDSAGSFVDEFATGIPGARFGGIAIDATNHYLYLADVGNLKIRAFGPGVFLPEVTIGATSGATNTTATLGGKVGPQGVALTDCHFEYVSDAAFAASGFDSATSASCSPSFDSIPADFATHSVSAPATGLVASTTYHVRLIAANATASLISDEAEFTTPGPVIVETVGAPIRTMTSAQLGGRVFPRNAAATYFFEYGNQGPCDTNPCAQTEPKSAGSSDSMMLVSEEVNGLQPNSTYHYRIIADNGNPDGADVGEDMTVTTRAEEAALSHGHFPGPTGSDRAWELVSAAESGGNPVGEAAVISDDGSRAVWGLGGGTPLTDSGGFNELYSERTPNGWKTVNAFPKRDQIAGPNWHGPAGPSDFSTFAALNFTISGKYSLFRVTPGAPPETLYEWESEETWGGFEVASDDGSRVLAAAKEDADPVHPAAPGTTNLYDVTTPGDPRMVSFLPGEVVSTCGIQVQVGAEGPFNGRSPVPWIAHWISTDGDLAFFPSTGNNCDSQPQLYMRDFDAGETRLLSGPTLSGPSCGAAFIRSTTTSVFFWTQARIATEDTAPSNCTDEKNDGDVYRFDLGSETLECVTCGVTQGDANVYIAEHKAMDEVAVAEDGSRLYFRAAGRLLPGATDEGVYRLRVGSDDLAYVGHSFGISRLGVSSLMTHDGSLLYFSSKSPSLNPLGGGAGNAGTEQFYRYDDGDRSLVCISCPRDGSAPRGAAFAPMEPGESANMSFLSRDGSIFAFSTPTPLVRSDQNTAASGQKPSRGGDVYEWRDGRLLLVSDGLNDWSGPESAPTVKGINPSGRDILFTAATQYTADAIDSFRRVYDARIGGGFNFPVPPAPCPLEVCQGTPKGAPEEQAPGTGPFSGPGNLNHSPPRCRKGKVRRRGRCVAKKSARKPHRSRANRNRRASR
jgi:hypothetical protein